MSPYFAYGAEANDDERRALLREAGYPHAKTAILGAAYLPDMEVTFDQRGRPRTLGGGVSAAPRLGAVLQGALISTDPAAWRGLSQIQAGLERKPRELVALTTDGRGISVVAFLSDAPMRFSPPIEDYLSVVEVGLAALRLDLGPLRAAARGEEGHSDLPIFVYGSLMQGQPSHALLEAAGVAEVREARTSGVLVDLGEYPGLIMFAPGKEDRGQVYGQLISLRDVQRALFEADRFEGFQGFGVGRSLFRRALVQARSEAGTQLAWTYVIVDPPADAKVIENGTWRRVGEGNA